MQLSRVTVITTDASQIAGETDKTEIWPSKPAYVHLFKGEWPPIFYVILMAFSTLVNHVGFQRKVEKSTKL